MRSDDGPTMIVCALLLIATVTALAAPPAAASTSTAPSPLGEAEPDSEGSDAGPCIYVSTDPPAVGYSERCPEGQYVDIRDEEDAPRVLDT